ncbi:30S ribosomal protein S13 [Candidatus Kuenenbacteria bacterium CG11_big_fil_rev_8_21_14_0_20_37_9]|uniref:Small ribosomal subunit protein uS13 n=2 Tax=Candidatus Kueneniibacteriota TaxID=1752740 RepID=A0A2M6XS81_9BACT|nr:MAG: 30S ribosomal protein S13 [Candidatus Kuenenbacteria bacterium CG1_02_38_13]PIR05689.1 MAG: 30S ribosomal protein S13 [Candidatus Kuenenbacteria bacterium CG11_big_fil_rev_8_21_14_0_20_37_9]PIU10493.1 MAG: 30S ribosomal protein S13 [Candidatus Kuenenbacteria bacterium CG08_land_8_20_14_0_20_37_23]
MARIIGVNLPNEKKLEVGLTYIFGIGQTIAKKIIEELKLDPNMKCKDLGDSHVALLRKTIESKYRVEGELKREIMGNIKRLKEINSYRGLRHAKKLPVRGQRTKTNSRTVRGNVRKTAGSGRKQSAQKT